MGSSATTLSRTILAKEISCVEVMQDTLARIRRQNPKLNAIVAFADETDFIEQAEKADLDIASGNMKGWLHGIPLAVKDLANSKYFVTSYGSPLVKDLVEVNVSSRNLKMLERDRFGYSVFVK